MSVEKIIEDVQAIKYEQPDVLVAKTTEYITAIDEELDNELLGLLQDCETRNFTGAYERLVQIDILKSIKAWLFELRKDARIRKWECMEE